MAKNEPFVPGDVVYFPRTNSCAIIICVEANGFCMQNVCLSTGKYVDEGDSIGMQHASATQKKMYFKRVTDIAMGRLVEEEKQKTIIDVAKEAINSKNNKK